ncbi:MAG: RibD family protein [Anaerolineae bacterium]|nr:RibD family protein [Anaerolineae bacterium]
MTLAYAQSLDGSIAARRGEPLTISGPESLHLTHQLRAKHDAILVGIGTVLSDDPQLTVRLVPGENPQPIILDTSLRFPPDARLFGNDRKPWIVYGETSFISNSDFGKRILKLESLGAQVISVPLNQNRRIDLPILVALLAEKGIKSLMVEGGAQVITSFLEESLVDEVILTISPSFIGGLRAIETNFAKNRNVPRLVSTKMEALGEDIIVFGQLSK